MQLRNLALALVSVVACTEPDEDRVQSFEYIHATIIEPYCATVGCHSAATAIEGYDFSAPTVETCSLLLNPNTDELIRGQGSGEYPQMPPDIPLGEADMELVLAWYATELAKPSGERCE